MRYTNINRFVDKLLALSLLKIIILWYSSSSNNDDDDNNSNNNNNNSNNNNNILILTISFCCKPWKIGTFQELI